MDTGSPPLRRVEQRIFESRNRYYAALKGSQEHWHEGSHTIWPWTEYLISVLTESYEVFESRIAAARGTDGLNKQERVRHWVANSAPVAFKLRDVRRALPGVSDQTIRLALKPLEADGSLRVDGAGPGATWVQQGAN